MKTKLLTLALSFGLIGCTLPAACAKDDAAPATAKAAKKTKKGKKAKAEKKQAEESLLGALLKENTYFNNKAPNFEADYFIFLSSASWCGPCNKEMPEVVNAYEKMKTTGKVELILLSNDQTQAAAESWLQKFNATFPAVMRGAKVPDNMPPVNGIPHATSMKADGTVVTSGHGSIIRGWKDATIGKYAAVGGEEKPCVGKAMKSMKFTNGKPNLKADYYMYFYAPKLDESIATELGSLSTQYKDMKKKKMEIIFITEAEKPAAINKALRPHKAKFPAIQKDAEGVSELPGLGEMGDKPKVWVVTQNKAFIAEGDINIISDWEEMVKANKGE